VQVRTVDSDLTLRATVPYTLPDLSLAIEMSV